MEKQLEKFGLNAERFSAIEHKEGCVGCILSHLNVLKIAKERKYSNILILEVDFLFLVSPEKFYENIKELEKYKDFDVCMISYNCNNYEDICDSIFIRINFASTTSGYIVNSYYYDKLISLYEWALPLLEKTNIHWEDANDIVWKDLQKNDNWIGFKERQGKQMASYSDCSKQFCDYDV
jgi:GR25 family glycosyltransferase involved in LPS biosynthesis